MSPLVNRNSAMRSSVPILNGINSRSPHGSDRSAELVYNPFVPRNNNSPYDLQRQTGTTPR